MSAGSGKVGRDVVIERKAGRIKWKRALVQQHTSLLIPEGNILSAHIGYTAEVARATIPVQAVIVARKATTLLILLWSRLQPQ